MSVSLSPTLLPPLLSLLFVSFLSFSPAPFCSLPPPSALTSLFHHFLFHGFIPPHLISFSHPLCLSLHLLSFFSLLSTFPSCPGHPLPPLTHSTCHTAEGWPRRLRAQADGTVPASGGHSVPQVPAARPSSHLPAGLVCGAGTMATLSSGRTGSLRRVASGGRLDRARGESGRKPAGQIPVGPRRCRLCRCASAPERAGHAAPHLGRARFAQAAAPAPLPSPAPEGLARPPLPGVGGKGFEVSSVCRMG